MLAVLCEHGFLTATAFDIVICLDKVEKLGKKVAKWLNMWSASRSGTN